MQEAPAIMRGRGNRSRRSRQRVALLAKDLLTEEVSMKNIVARFFENESGVTAIEYGLIAALISVVCIAAMTFAGQQLLLVYNRIGNALAAAL
jgi:pilus assembly protein Flp/PilA